MKPKLLLLAVIALFAITAIPQTTITEAEYNEITRIQDLRQAGKSVEEMRAAVYEALAKMPDSEPSLLMSADLAGAASDNAGVISAFRRLVELKPKNADFHGMLAIAYLKSAQDAEALAEARAALALDVQSPYGNFALGMLFYELGEHQEASRLFARVSSDDPRLLGSEYYRALSESNLGNKEAAAALLKTLAERAPDDFAISYELAKILTSLRRGSEAEPIFKMLLAQRPRDPLLQAGMGMLYSQQMQFEKAIPYFDEALRLRPGDEFFLMFLNVTRGRQQTVAVLPQLLQKLSEEPKNARFHLEAVQALAFANRQEEAQRLVQDLYALDPKDPELYVAVSIVFTDIGLREPALDALKRSLAKADNPAAHLNLASAYETAGKLDLALEHYAKVIQAKPDAGRVMKGYADVLAKAGKRREALDMYKRSLSIVPTFAPSLFQAAILSDKLGDRTSAAQYLATLKSIDPALARKLDRYLKLRLWG